MADVGNPVDPIQSGGSQIPDADQIDLLLEEYKIVQTKIDKLGEDMFKVRSWCITLFTGVAAGAKLSGGLSPSIVVILMPIVCAFQVVEYRQRQISRRAVIRGRNIEAAFRHRMRKSKIKTTFAPNLATQLLADGVNDKKNCTLRGWLKRKLGMEGQQKAKSATDSATTEAGASEKEFEVTKRPPTLGQCLVAQADFLFYGAQYFVIVSIFIGAFFAAKKSESAVSIQFGTNSICITSAVTNIVATNYVYQSQTTTNFIVKQAYTTNFMIVTIPITNFSVVSSNQNLKPRN